MLSDAVIPCLAMRSMGSVLLTCLLCVSKPGHADAYDAARTQNQGGVFIGGAFRFSDEGTAQSSPGLEIPDAAAATLVIWLPHSATTNVELYSSHFDSDLGNNSNGPSSALKGASMRIDHLQIGGIKMVDDAALAGFVGATLGITTLELSAAQSDRETRWAYSLVGGFLWRLTPALNLRFDARWLSTIFNSSTDLTCDQAQCKLQFDAGVWSQYELGVSLGVRF